MSLAIPKQVVVWQFSGIAGHLKSMNQYAPNTGYNMLCRTNGQYLTWDKQTFGINLGYTGDAKQRKVHFALPDKRDREVLSGEPVALGIGGSPAFLRYSHRNVGINLEWAETPVYQWRIYGPDAKEGEPIDTGRFVSIVNDKVEPNPDFLIHFDRPVGADIGWTSSPEFWSSMIDAAGKLAVSAARQYLKSQVPA